MILLRSIFYYLGVAPLTVFFVTLSLIIFPLPFPVRYKIIRHWSWSSLWWLKLTCQLDYQVSGLDNIPDEPAIIMCNHQSAWETLALQKVFPVQVWVLKKELLWIPIFGWGLATLNPIAIDRSSARQALKQVIDQGRQRLEKGYWVTIFPEGTRIAPGEKHRYARSGGLLSEKTQAAIIPVAHNAGVYWPKNSFLKKPGTIKMVIGPVIHPNNKNSEQITEEVRQWIEPTVDQLLEKVK